MKLDCMNMYMTESDFFCYGLARNGCPLQKGELNTLKQLKEGALNLVALWTPGKESLNEVEDVRPAQVCCCFAFN